MSKIDGAPRTILQPWISHASSFLLIMALNPLAHKIYRYEDMGTPSKLLVEVEPHQIPHLVVKIKCNDFYTHHYPINL